MTDQPDGCAGWAAGYMKPATADYINKNDPQFTKWVLAHNEHGVDQRCWKGSRPGLLGIKLGS